MRLVRVGGGWVGGGSVGSVVVAGTTVRVSTDPAKGGADASPHKGSGPQCLPRLDKLFVCIVAIFAFYGYYGRHKHVFRV